MSYLKPAAILTLGSSRYESHVYYVDVSLSFLPGIGSFRAMLPVGTELDAAPEDDAELVLDGGEGAATVVKGRVHTLEHGLRSIRVCAADAGALLAARRAAATYEKQTAAQIISALAGETDAEIGATDIDLQLPLYIAHQERTIAEHIAGLAELAGCYAAVDAAGRLNVRPWPQGQADVALRYGRELLHYRSSRAAAPARRKVLVGNSPAASMEAPDVLRPGFERLPGSASEPAADVHWLPAPVLKTPSAASAAGDAANLLAAAQSARLQATCFLLPALRPGMVVEVQDLPGAASGGPWILTGVRHRLQADTGGRTYLEGRSAEGGGLLGSLLGAAGGLF